MIRVLNFLFGLTFLVTACSGQAVAPTATETSPVVTSTVTPTESATPTPESTLLPGSISELQEKLGNNYQLTAEEDHFVIKGIDNLKFYQDGTSELTYKFQDESENLTVAFQAISVAEDGALCIGPCCVENGVWTMLTAAAPKTIEDTDSFPKVAYLEGHPKEAEIEATIHRYVQMALTKTESYDPMDEFRGINIALKNGETVTNVDVTPEIWQAFETPQERDYFPVVPHYNDPSGQYFEARPMQIALGQGWFQLNVYDISGSQIFDLVGVPIIAMNTDRTLISMSGLIKSSELSPKILGLMTKVKRALIEKVLPKTSKVSSGKEEAYVSDENLREFLVARNQAYLDKDFEWEMFSLPPELSTMVFFDFEVDPDNIK